MGIVCLTSYYFEDEVWIAHICEQLDFNIICLR